MSKKDMGAKVEGSSNGVFFHRIRSNSRDEASIWTMGPWYKLPIGCRLPSGAALGMTIPSDASDCALFSVTIHADSIARPNPVHGDDRSR